MSKFSIKTPVSKGQTTNKVGEIAFKMTPENELLSAVLTSFLSDGAYESSNDRLARIKSLVENVAVTNPKFLLGLVIKARTEYHMRSTSHVLIAEISKHLKWDAFKMSEFISDGIERVDDMSEIIAYLLPEAKANKKAKKGVISHSMVKGLNKAFTKFDEYQLAKYDRDWSINLKDIVRLSHSGWELAKKILNDELKTPDTWEVKISAISKDDTDYKNKIFSAWEELIKNKSLGYMATLRNLKNIINAADGVRDIDSNSKAKADDLVKNITDFLTNPTAVENSKQLPFRFLAAYKTISSEFSGATSSIYLKEVKSAIKKAAELSIKNMSISWDIAVFADVSGSMESTTSKKSSMRMIDIWLLFSGMANKISSRSIVGIFGDSAKFKEVGDGIFDAVENYNEGEVGYSTNGYKAIDLLTSSNKKVDTIMLFTDCELYDTSPSIKASTSSSRIDKAISEYMTKVNPDVKVVLFNLAGNGTNVSKKNNVYSISGWSEKVFEYMKMIDTMDENSVVRECEVLGNKYTR